MKPHMLRPVTHHAGDAVAPSDTVAHGLPVSGGPGESSGQAGSDWMAERLSAPRANAQRAGETPFEQLDRASRRSSHAEGAGRAIESKRGSHK